MFSFAPRSLVATLVYAVILTSVLSAPIPQGQSQPGAGQEAQQGQPLSVGQAASPTAQASAIFGTTTDAPNFKNSPTGVCIVPALASDAGFGTAQVPLTTEQALELCPNATRIVVQAQTAKRGTQGAGQAGNSGSSNNQGSSQPTNDGNTQQGNGQVGNGNNGNNGATLGKPISAGQAASPTAQASTVFGTTTSSPNFSSSPTGVCIVPMFANEAGLGSDKTPLTNEQAMELCPNATNIVVCST